MARHHGYCGAVFGSVARGPRCRAAPSTPRRARSGSPSIRAPRPRRGARGRTRREGRCGALRVEPGRGGAGGAPNSGAPLSGSSEAYSSAHRPLRSSHAGNRVGEDGAVGVGDARPAPHQVQSSAWRGASTEISPSRQKGSSSRSSQGFRVWAFLSSASMSGLPTAH